MNQKQESLGGVGAPDAEGIHNRNTNQQVGETIMSSITEPTKARILDWCREARRALGAGAVVPAVPMSMPDWAETVELHTTKHSVEVTFKSRAFAADRMSAHLQLTASIYSDDEFFADGRLFAKAGSVLANGHPCVLVDGTVNQIDTLEESPEELRNLASVLLDAAAAQEVAK